MKTRSSLFIICLLFIASVSNGQKKNPVIDIFPEGTVLYGNIPYNNDKLERHLLDIYLPKDAKKPVPLVIFVHGGGWLSNDKYADMGYMKRTIKEIIQSGFALVSIDYRYATDSVFPAQIRDCNKAVSYLYDNADKYGFDRKRFALMGFSAGGHLASLTGLSINNKVADFFMPGSSANFSFRGVVDFYGPSDLVSLKSSEDPNSAEAKLIGAAPIARPDLARRASPVTWVDKNDPPFLIIHGENDDMVWNRQSKLLSSWLTVNGVENELIIVPGAPHYGEMFDADAIRTKVMAFLLKHLKQ